MVLFLQFRIMGGLSRMDPLIASFSTKIPYILLSKEKSIVSTLTPQNNQINFSFKNRNTLYSDISKQSVPATISFSFKEDDFPPLTNGCRPASKSGNCSNHVTARSIVFWSNVSGHVKRLYQCKPFKAVCSSNVSKQNACNVSSVSKLVKPLTVSKPVCSTVESKSNICNASIVSQHVKPLNVSKSMSSCNVRNRNVHIVNSISHHTKPLNVGKSDCSRHVSKPVIRESVVVNLVKVLVNDVLMLAVISMVLQSHLM